MLSTLDLDKPVIGLCFDVDDTMVARENYFAITGGHYAWSNLCSALQDFLGTDTQLMVSIISAKAGPDFALRSAMLELQDHLFEYQKTDGSKFTTVHLVGSSSAQRDPKIAAKGKVERMELIAKQFNIADRSKLIIVDDTEQVITATNAAGFGGISAEGLMRPYDRTECQSTTTKLQEVFVNIGRTVLAAADLKLTAEQADQLRELAVIEFASPGDFAVDMLAEEPAVLQDNTVTLPAGSNIRIIYSSAEVHEALKSLIVKAYHTASILTPTKGPSQNSPLASPTDTTISDPTESFSISH